MREFKFRAWNKRIQEMVDLEEITYLALNADIPGIFIRYHEDLVIMQYTGIKDKNGKEIYEGDILKVKELSVLRGDFLQLEKSYIYINVIVYWSNNKAMFLMKQIGHVPKSYAGAIPLGYKEFKDIEVIGNIYENQELLETFKEDL